MRKIGKRRCRERRGKARTRNVTQERAEQQRRGSWGAVRNRAPGQSVQEDREGRDDGKYATAHRRRG